MENYTVVNNVTGKSIQLSDGELGFLYLELVDRLDELVELPKDHPEREFYADLVKLRNRMDKIFVLEDSTV